jgi:hypothetical protein
MSPSEHEAPPPARLLVPPACGEERSSGVDGAGRPFAEMESFRRRPTAPSFLTVLLRALSTWPT